MIRNTHSNDNNGSWQVPNARACHVEVNNHAVCGAARQWSSETVEQRDSGIVRQWSSETVEQRDSGIVRQWSSETVEQRDSGIVRQWSSEIVA